MSKVIFLDVDGVLNRHHSLYGTKEMSPMGFTGVGQKHLLELRRIVDATSARIILTSDWKDCFTTDGCDPKKANADGEYLVKRLKDVGLRIVERTNDQPLECDRGKGFGGRGYGIRKYLKQHPDVTEYVILDDVEFRDFTGELLDHFVYLEYPLTKRSADRAIKILLQGEKETMKRKQKRKCRIT